MATQARLGRIELTLLEKVLQLNWPFVALVTLIAAVGYGTLYSAAGGSHEPWAWRHALRFTAGLGLMLAIALIDLRLWFRWAYAIFGTAFAALLAVGLIGTFSKGAQRWIDLGVIQLQPSEVMKVALVLALARYFHAAYLDDVRRPMYLLPPLAMMLVPAALVLKQPDLGTAVMLVLCGGAMLFLAGVRLWKFGLLFATAGAAVPILWARLHDYQRQRVLTFLEPERDPLGAGYHIIQSKIALGSGGVWGKGFLQGTQAQLQFLPEKQTDFVFTMLAEEAGLIGALFVLALHLAIVTYGIIFALRARSQFARLLAMGLTLNFFLYIAINVAMVTGLIPVVGVPLPLISYGGTAMLTVLVGFGLLLSVDVHQDTHLARFPTDQQA
jgi:rod shape determining protein RodA